MTGPTSKQDPRTSQFSHSEAISSHLSASKSTPYRISQHEQLHNQLNQQSAGRQSDGVYSTSTNNLEKAYDELEKEIREIKMRLEGSQGPSGSIDQITGHSTVKQPTTLNERSADRISASVSGASQANAYLTGLGRSDRGVQF